MNKVNIGSIINTRGLKGELKIKSDFDLKLFNNVFINDLNFKIKSVKLYKDFQYVVFENLDDINKVEKYKGSFIFVSRDDIELEENIFLVSELIGYEVLNIGEVIDVFNNNAHDILRVKTASKDVLIPFLDVFVKEINDDLKTIKVELLEDAN